MPQRKFPILVSSKSSQDFPNYSEFLILNRVYTLPYNWAFTLFAYPTILVYSVSTGSPQSGHIVPWNP